MGRRRRRNNSSLIAIVIILLVVALIGCGVLIYILLQDRETGSTDINNLVDMDKIDELNESGVDAEPIESKEYVISTIEGSKDLSSLYEQFGMSEEEAVEKYGLPADKSIDLSEYTAKNKDVYAYLYVPGTGIDSPVLQNEEDALYYDTHGVDGTEDGKGCLYTQILNNKEFTDNVTVIYGKSSDENQFTGLKAFRDPKFFSENPYIYVYGESEIYIYQVFAEYEYENRHIIIFHSTADDEMYQIYLEQIKDFAGLNSNTNEEIWPVAGDKVLTLSSDAGGLSDKRFLVQGKLVGIVAR